jgi:ABC-type nitrate/sulfonate/bicarbonate transport system permease component
MSSRHLPTVLGTAAAAGAVVLWQWLATPPTAVNAGAVGRSLADHRSLLTSATGTTVREAAVGLLIGAGAAALAAWSAHLVGLARGVLQQVMLICYVTPLVAVGPLLTATVERGSIPVISAALSATLPVFSATLTGLDTVPTTLRAVLAVCGAPPLRRLLLVSLPHSVPHVLEGLKLALPSAVLGALVGEWFGAEQGLGVLLVSGLRESQDDLVGAVTVLVLIVSLAGYTLVAQCAGIVRRRRGLAGGAG